MIVEANVFCCCDADWLVFELEDVAEDEPDCDAAAGELAVLDEKNEA